MKIALWICILSALALIALPLFALSEYVTYPPAVGEITSSQKTYIPAYNGTSAARYSSERSAPLSGLGFTISAILILLGIPLYFLPTFISWTRGHQQTGPIVILNVLLGWTFLGWVIALAWSASAIDASRAKE